MARPNCVHGNYKGDLLPQECKFYAGRVFKPLKICHRCILYKPNRVPKSPMKQGASCDSR